MPELGASLDMPKRERVRFDQVGPIWRSGPLSPRLTQGQTNPDIEREFAYGSPWVRPWPRCKALVAPRTKEGRVMNETRALSCLLPLTFIALLGACEWKVQPAGTEQSLSDENGCTEDPHSGILGYRIPCGEAFTATVHGECKACNDPECTQLDRGRECVCHAIGTFCLDTDAGERCGYQGERCDCDDDKGARYVCECEGGGDDCHCRIPNDLNCE
jgi:hypothetical protein